MFPYGPQARRRATNPTKTTQLCFKNTKIGMALAQTKEYANPQTQSKTGVENSRQTTAELGARSPTDVFQQIPNGPSDHDRIGKVECDVKYGADLPDKLSGPTAVWPTITRELKHSLANTSVEVLDGLGWLGGVAWVSGGTERMALYYAFSWLTVEDAELR